MPMPSSGAVSLSDAQTVFSDTGSISLGDLYRGGSLVPSTRYVDTSYFVPETTETQTTYNTFGSPVYDPNPATEKRWYVHPDGSFSTLKWKPDFSAASTSPSSSLYEAGGYQYERLIPIEAGWWSVRRRTVTTEVVVIPGYWVNSGYTENINTSIPTSGTLSMSQLYGATAS